MNVHRTPVVLLALIAVMLGSVVGIVGIVGFGGQVSLAATVSKDWLPDAVGGGGAVYNALDDVSCASTVFCVAVGDTTDLMPIGGGGTAVRQHQPLVEMYDGDAWAATPAPRLPASPDSELISVSCPNEQFCIAVGYWTPPSGSVFGTVRNELIDIFHDGKWSVDEDSNPGQVSSAILSGVSCRSFDFCMAVGTDEVQGNWDSLAEGFDGTAWTLQETPEYSDNWHTYLQAVSCTSSAFCMAVGAGSTDVIPVGSAFDQTLYYGTSAVPFAVTFTRNGAEPGEWATTSDVLPTSIANGGPLFGVSCVTATFCGAVGGATLQAEQPTDTEYSEPTLATWNGTEWTATQDSTQPIPSDAAGDGMYAIDCAAVNDCTAVGGFSWLNQSVDKPNGSIYTDPLFETYNGSGWAGSTVSPRPTYQFGTFLGLDCDTHQDCVAVGTYAQELSGPPTSSPNPLPYPSASMDDFGYATGDLVPPPPKEGTLVVVPGSADDNEAGSGTVTSSPAGIDCPPKCTASYKATTKVTLRAVAAAGSVIDVAHDPQLSLESCTPAWSESAEYVRETCATTVTGGGYDAVPFDFAKFASTPLTDTEFGSANGSPSDDLANIELGACSSGASSYAFAVDGKPDGPAQASCGADASLGLGHHEATVVIKDSDGLRKATEKVSFDVVPQASFSWTVAPIPYGSDATGTPTAVMLDACGSAFVKTFTWHVAGSGLRDTTTTSCKWTARLPVSSTYATTLTVTAPGGQKVSTTQSIFVPAEYLPPPPCSYLSFSGATSCWRQGWDWFQDVFGTSGAPDRPPDFAVLQVGAGPASGSITVTCDGNVYYGGGVDIGAGVGPSVSGVLAFGYASDPTEGEPANSSIDGFVQGLSGSLSLSAVGAGVSLIDSNGSWGVAYFSGWTGPSVSVGLSYDFADPSDQDPGDSTCSGGVTSSATWQQFANNGLQSSDGLPSYVPAAPPPATPSGSDIFVAAPAHTFAPGSEVTVSVLGVKGASVATAANDHGALGARIEFPVALAPGLHHLVLTGVGPGGTSDTNDSVRLPVVAKDAGKGALLATAGGSVTPLGLAKSYPLRDGKQPTAGVVGLAATPDGGGYWSVTSAGAVASFGDALTYPRRAGTLTAPAVGIAPTADGHGYWIADSAGDVAAYGDARSYLPSATPLTGTIVAIAATPDGGGYWLVNSAGDVWAYGDAQVETLSGGAQPTGDVVGLVPDVRAPGYWLATSSGAVSSYGGAEVAKGSAATGTIVGLAATPDGAGYWLVNTAGGVFPFGDAPAMEPAKAPHEVVAVADL